MPVNEVHHDDPVLYVVTLRNVTLSVWTGSPELAQWQAVGRISEALSKRNGAERAMLSVVVRGLPKFNDVARGELVKVMKNPAYFPVGVAHLVLLDGLAGSTVRAFLSTARLLSRSSVPAAVFGAEDEAILWILEKLRGTKERWNYRELHEFLTSAIKSRQGTTPK